MSAAITKAIGAVKTQLIDQVRTIIIASQGNNVTTNEEKNGDKEGILYGKILEYIGNDRFMADFGEEIESRATQQLFPLLSFGQIDAELLADVAKTFPFDASQKDKDDVWKIFSEVKKNCTGTWGASYSAATTQTRSGVRDDKFARWRFIVESMATNTKT